MTPNYISLIIHYSESNMDRVNFLRTMRWNQTHPSLNLQGSYIYYFDSS